jgi:[protein-PII] uridylyltransferase
VLLKPSEVQDPLAGRARLVDETVRMASRALPDSLGLFAVGGYGRGELYPHSDIDLLILTPDKEATREERAAISEFLRQLWDSGLRVAQSVRDPESCGRWNPDNVELTISLLDRRPLGGNAALAGRLTREFTMLLARAKSKIRQALAQKSRDRHARFDGTIFHLEPDVKEGPGGLRDGQSLRWFGKLDLETEPLDLSMLPAVRYALHQRSGRDQNLLSFEAQEDLLAEFPSVAAGMRELFREARAVHAKLQRQLTLAEAPAMNLSGQWQQWQARLSNREFTVLRQRVWLRTPDALDLAAALRLFVFCARHGLDLAPSAEHALQQWNGHASATWDFWRELLTQRHAATGLRILERTGFLTRLLPEWQAADCLVIPDFYHRYTVDEHTLRTLEILDSLAASSSILRFDGLAKETPRIELLRFALLLHDLGKGTGQDHSERSESIATQVLDRLECPPADRDSVLMLVRHHLLLSQLAMTRDLDDRAGLASALETIGTVENLKRLTVMTVCDAGAVNPDALKPWRRDQIWRAYTALHGYLLRNVDDSRLAAESGFAAGFPRRYGSTHSLAEVEFDERLVQLARTERVATSLQPASGGLRLTVVAKDRRGLFADLAGAVSAFGLNIVRAEAYTSQEGFALDRFFCEDPFRTIELNPPEVARLEQLVQRAARGQLDLARELQRRREPQRPARARIQPAVAVDRSGRRTIFEVLANDRIGLLYDLARTLADAGCDLDVVLVNTEGPRALDVFYVTQDGRGLDDHAATKLRQQLLAVLP